MRRFLLALGVLVLAALALRSCGSRPEGVPAGDGPGETTGPARPAPEAGGAASGDALPELTCEGLEGKLLASEPAPDALAEAFGPPEARSSSTEPNRHVPGAIDTVSSLSWGGLEMRFRKPPDSEALPVHALIEGERFLRHPSLGPGAPAERVVQLLGEPTRREGGALVYDCGMGASQPVRFHLDGEERVERVEISFYVG